MTDRRPTEGRIRFAAILSLLGIAVEAVTLNILHPLSFVVFAGVGVGFILLGLVLYLLALLRAAEVPSA